MSRLPPPGSFAEGQRLIYGLLAAAGGIFCGAGAVAMVALLMWGGWSAREEHSIVVIFGWSLGGFILAMIAVIVGLLAAVRLAVQGRRRPRRSLPGGDCTPTSRHDPRLLNLQG